MGNKRKLGTIASALAIVTLSIPSGRTDSTTLDIALPISISLPSRKPIITSKQKNLDDIVTDLRTTPEHKKTGAYYERIAEQIALACNIAPHSQKDESYYKTLAERIASHYQLDPRLSKIKIGKESSWNPKAISGKGAVGLTGFTPVAALDIGFSKKDIYLPEINLVGGAIYMKKLLTEFGSLELALAAYNAGPTRVREYGGIPPFKETINYVASITRRYRTNP